LTVFFAVLSMGVPAAVVDLHHPYAALDETARGEAAVGEIAAAIGRAGDEWTGGGEN
jgi:hypothetical protein